MTKTKTAKRPAATKAIDSTPCVLNIGDKTWSAGDLVTIISEPYMLHGAEWQDAATESGKVVTITTARQRELNSARKRQEWQESQAGFARLGKLAISVRDSLEL